MSGKLECQAWLKNSQSKAWPRI